jgi:opacity protein-like surface antigen
MNPGNFSQCYKSIFMTFTKTISFLLLVIISYKAGAQDTTDLMNILEREMAPMKDMTFYTTATFKTTRLVNGHSVENVAKGVLDVKISHRFGNINEGGYELFGLDKATMRMGLDYGITPYLMVGVGRSTYQKTYDAFFKLKILRQSKGKRKMPITLSYVPTIALRTLKYEDPNLTNFYTSRLFYTHQLIIGRKFSEGTSLQLMPTFIHQNLVTGANDPNDMFAIGIGGRQKISKRISVNAEYYYQIPGYKQPGTVNVLSIGFDIETGGHVFQLHFTNSQGMNERSFITDTKGKWEKGDILFGFNISRVFTIGKNR